MRNADGQAVIYSDVLEYIDRENELAEGLELRTQAARAIEARAGPTAGV
jgi:hypothetical protein